MPHKSLNFLFLEFFCAEILISHFQSPESWVFHLPYVCMGEFYFHSQGASILRALDSSHEVPREGILMFLAVGTTLFGIRGFASFLSYVGRWVCFGHFILGVIV